MFYRPDEDNTSAFSFSLPLAGAEWMTAPEQMFFLGSPLAHVVRYEEELRHDRIRRSTHLGQARRIIAEQWLLDNPDNIGAQDSKGAEAVR